MTKVFFYSNIRAICSSKGENKNMITLNMNSFARIELFTLGEKIIKDSNLDIAIDENHRIVLPIKTIMKIFGPYISKTDNCQLFNYNLELPSMNANYNIGNLAKVFLNNKGLEILMKINQFLVNDCIESGVKPACIPLAEDCSVTMPLKDIMNIFGVYLSYSKNKVAIPFDVNIEVAKNDLEPIIKKTITKNR